jgi:hypothetical protein
MKCFFTCLIIVITLYGCKKDNNKTVDVIASPAHLAAINTQLDGTWAYNNWRIDFKGVSGIPGSGSLPLGASVVFSNGSAIINRFNYEANSLNPISYQLSGLNSVDYVNVKDTTGFVRKCRILLLTADSLKLENIITSKDTSTKLTFNEVWTKASDAEVTGALFKIVINSLNGLTYNPGATVTVYLKPAGGAEKVLNVQAGVTGKYSYSFHPKIGDHIRITIRNAAGGNPDVVQVGASSYPRTLVYYKGIAYGNGWTIDPVARAFDQQWDITN